MWHVANQTPYKADGSWGRDKDGVHEWIVAVTGTFDIRPDGTVTLADEQRPPLVAPEYQGEDGQSSLRYEADLIALKPTTDVLINGTAYAPKGQPSTDFLASLKVGSIDKTLRVRGHRQWEGPSGASPSRPEPVADVPVVYERAFGGYDHSDP